MQRSDEYRGYYRSDADASEVMRHRQAGDCGYGDHRTVKTDFYSGKLDAGDLRDGLHRTLTCQWNQLNRQAEKNAERN